MDFCLDSYQSSIPIRLGLCFGDIDPVFKLNSRLTKVEFIAKIEILLDQMYGYPSDLSGYIIVTCLRYVKVLVILTPFSRS